MTEKEKTNWLSTDKVNLFIAEEYYHHHAYEIMNTHLDLKTRFCQMLNTEINVIPRIKKKKNETLRAIKADHLNQELRRVMTEDYNTDVKLEVSEDKGVFYFASHKSSIGGFDFAFIDHYRNLLALRNICFGELSYHNGIKRWNSFLEKNEDLNDLALKIQTEGKIGQNIDFDRSIKQKPLIVGEIQFGNWALVYRDFFKVLKANVQNSVDCLIYVVPTNNLEKSLSEGIVTFDKTVRVIKDFEKVINVPVWVVGLDVD